METKSENRRSRKSSYPFYAQPSCVLKTSAEIIREARAEMASKTISNVHSPQSIRTVNTKRPFTPCDTNRMLFGNMKLSGRPPSAINIHQVKFHDLDVASLPKIAEAAKIEQKITLPISPLMKLKQRVRLPAITDSLVNKKQLQQISLENLPKELPEIKYLKKLDSGKKSKELICSENSIKEVEESEEENINEPNQNLNIIETESNLDIINDKNETWTPKDYKTKGFPHDIYSPRKIVGMDKLMESSEVNDIAIEENRINEARAADVAESFKTSNDVFIEEIETVEEPTVESTINKLNELSNNDWTDMEVIQLLDLLYITLEKEHVTTSKNNKIKSHVLKAIFKYVETSSEPLLLHIARIILVLRVNGQNLSAVFKLVFKVARCAANDKHFMEKNILEQFIESLGRASPLEDAEACIYGYGALKFLTMNNLLLQEILKLGTLELMVLHLKIVNNGRLEFVPIPEQTSHALFQLTGALRNIASEDGIFSQFASTGAVFELCRSMQLFSADLDLMSNIARTLSIISTNDECCQCVIDYEGCFRIFTKLLHKFPGRQDIVVRLGYALGNIMAKSNSARIQLYQEAGALKAILDLLDNYLEKDLEMQIIDPEVTFSTPHLGSDGSVEDVIIKMIRVIANMCMHSDVGVALVCGTKDENEESMYIVDANKRDSSHFLDILLKILRRKSLHESEELVLSTLSTFNNLSFYSNPESYASLLYDGPFVARQIEIAEALNLLMLSDNEECLVEVTRVLGNLTRCKQIRDYLLETGGLCLLVRFLEKDNEELLTTTTGVLVNMMSDWDKRIALKEDNGIARLIWILGKYGESNWKLANLICQTIWNFCIDSTHLYAALGVQPTNDLLSVLVDLLDEERLFGINEDCEIDERILESQDYQLWEDFANVATNLLEKIEQYLESVNLTLQETTCDQE